MSCESRSDEHAVLDDRRVLVHAVVVAGDRAGADVDVARRSSRRRDTPDGWPSSRGRASSSSARRNCRRARPRRRPMPAAGARTGRCARRVRRASRRSRDGRGRSRRRRSSRSSGATPAWIRQRSPIVVVPSSTTPGPMTVSAPIVTSASMYVVGGILERDAAEHQRRGSCGRADRAPSSARSTRLFTPRSSVGESTQKRFHACSFCCRYVATRSVR